MADQSQSIPITGATLAASQAIHDPGGRRHLPPSAALPADHPGSAPGSAPLPPGLSEQLAFRTTFLWRFHRPGVAEAFRPVGDALFDLLNEAGEWGPSNGPPITHGELGAACTDLEHLASYLEEVAAERHNADLDETSEALAGEAGGWAGRLSRLVLDMRQSLTEAAAALAAENSPPQETNQSPH